MFNAKFEVFLNFKTIINNCKTTSVGGDILRNLRATVAPNPAIETTFLKISLAHDETATVSLYSAMGQLVSATTHRLVSGENAVELNLAELQTGIYFVRISTKDATSKMIPVLKSASLR